jgi:hypothetical protein
MLPANRRVARCQSIGVCLALVALGFWFIVPQLHRVATHYTGDFGHFYFAAKAMAAGDDIYSSWHGGYIYPPLLAFVYLPLTPLSEESAALVLLCINMGFLFLAAWLGARELIDRFGLVRDTATAGTLVLAGMVLMVDKIKGELQMWQTNALLLLLFMLALRFLDRRPIRSGLALGFAFNIKYLPLVLLPYLLLRRRWLALGSFLAGIGLFALLPAPIIGWDVNLHYLAAASRGVFRLFGMHVGPEQGANIAEIRSKMSVSITSALARTFPSDESLLVPYTLVGLVGLAAAGVAFWMYRRQGFAFVYRPDGSRPNDPAARVLTALEWMGSIVAALVFSPQTNTRHLVLLLPVQLAGAALVMAAHAGIPRLPLLLGMLLLTLGLVLPPGGAGYGAAVHFWHCHGGPCWCALAMYGTLLWTGLRYAAMAPSRHGFPV